MSWDLVHVHIKMHDDGYVCNFNIQGVMKAAMGGWCVELLEEEEYVEVSVLWGGLHRPSSLEV